MSPAEASSESVAAGPKLRLLLVDDNRDLSGMLSLLLKRVGYEIEVAHDGPAAIRAVADNRPDVVLLDIGLPGMNGHDVAREIRRHDELADVVLIAMTGYGQESDMERARQSGFNDFLLKPVALEAIQKMLSTVKPGGPRPPRA